MIELLSYGDAGWGDEILAGAGVTASLALATLPFGLALGFLLALAKRSEEPSLRAAADIYTTIFRGLPELLTLFIVFYGLPLLVNTVWGIVTGADGKFQVNSFFAGVIALAAVFSAYASEVFLSAFRGVPHGQHEGARALGLRRFAAMRLVVLPQLLRLALPGLSNLWMILLKETALVSVIALPDLLRHISIAARATREPFLFYALACGLYLALTIVSAIGIRRIERRAWRGAAG